MRIAKRSEHYSLVSKHPGSMQNSTMAWHYYFMEAGRYIERTYLYTAQFFENTGV